MKTLIVNIDNPTNLSYRRRIFMIGTTVARWAAAACASLGAVAAHAQCTTDSNVWNLRENGDDRFHSNEAYVRPWRFDFDDGVGRWVGNYSYEIPWIGAGTIGDGGFTISRGGDRQFSAWTYVYLAQAATVEVTGGGDCVPRLFWDYAFDSPQEFSESNFPSAFLNAGWHRIDITGYNQNSGYTATFSRPTAITQMSHSLPPLCPGDANRDCLVNFADITTILENFGATHPVGSLQSRGDANHDGVVTFADITQVLTSWNVGCS